MVLVLKPWNCSNTSDILGNCEFVITQFVFASAQFFFFFFVRNSSWMQSTAASRMQCGHTHTHAHTLFNHQLQKPHPPVSGGGELSDPFQITLHHFTTHKLQPFCKLQVCLRVKCRVYCVFMYFVTISHVQNCATIFFIRILPF